jgi:hypothetical protein
MQSHQFIVRNKAKHESQKFAYRVIIHKTTVTIVLSTSCQNGTMTKRAKERNGAVTSPSKDD